MDRRRPGLAPDRRFAPVSVARPRSWPIRVAAFAAFWLLGSGPIAGAQEPAPGAARIPESGAGSSAARLTDAERAAGFVLLFDGQTAKGWRGYRQAGFPSTGWQIEEGALVRAKGSDGKPGPGDLITSDQFDNFELRAEFRLSPGANSGIKYLVVENPAQKEPGQKDPAQKGEGKPQAQKAAIAFEYQILDDERHPDAKQGKAGNRTLAGLYDLIAPPADKATRPVGSWNEARIIVSGNHVEHWLNGQKTVTYERQSPALRALIAGSKYKTVPGFGESRRGHILLQDHGDVVAFRNLRLRRLPPVD